MTVSDTLEIINNGMEEMLTNDLNTVDDTGLIKFMHEKESEGFLPFLDTLLVTKEDDSVKLLVYRKKTHTNQYLDFKSHYPLHQKIGVIRTLMERCKKFMSEEVDRAKER